MPAFKGHLIAASLHVIVKDGPCASVQMRLCLQARDADATSDVVLWRLHRVNILRSHARDARGAVELHCVPALIHVKSERCALAAIELGPCRQTVYMHSLANEDCAACRCPAIACYATEHHGSCRVKTRLGKG